VVITPSISVVQSFGGAGTPLPIAGGRGNSWRVGELAFLDPKMPCELGVISSHLVDEPLGVLATDEHLDRVPERMVEAAALVADDVDDHRGGDVTAASFVDKYKEDSLVNRIC
jgi:hypothetical protein